MKKSMLISGIAIIAVASYIANVKAAMATDRPAKAAPIQNAEQDSMALKVVNDFFDSFKKGATPDEIAAKFDVNADYFIPGDTKNVPWIGHRTGRDAIKESFRLLRENIQPEKLVFTDMLAKGDRVVVLGYLESRMKKNNKQMKSEFSIDIVVKNGLLTRYHLLEDSFEVSDKAK
ncbi:nuclear transport factor 2 family protein [Spirosoma litoris]